MTLRWKLHCLVGASEKKNITVFGMGDSYFAFKLIRPQLNDNEKKKKNPASAFQKKTMTSERLSSLPAFPFRSISESQKAHNPQISLLIN